MLLKKLSQKNYCLLKSCLHQLYLDKIMTQLLLYILFPYLLLLLIFEFSLRKSQNKSDKLVSARLFSFFCVRMGKKGSGKHSIAEHEWLAILRAWSIYTNKQAITLNQNPLKIIPRICWLPEQQCYRVYAMFTRPFFPTHTQKKKKQSAYARLAMNSIANGTNSFANGTKSIVKRTNSIAKTCK